MASDYLTKFVLIGYFRENQSAGSGSDRQNWSNAVFQRYDQHISDACLSAGFNPSDEARSIIAVMASMSPGNANKTRARQAVRAYLEYRGF
jgi:hypothetical protein